MNTPPAVLLVDDAPVILALMRQALENAGYRVWSAPDVNRGRALIERELPAVVVLDLVMSPTNGFQLLEWIKNRPSRPRLLMVTASDGNRAEAHARELGVDDYLRKPLDMDRFLAVARRLCPWPAGESHEALSGTPS
jgi:DNA-binding response OmpR family regulator